MIDDRWRMSSSGLWQWAWKQGTSSENQSGLVCLGDILTLGGWIWDDFRFPNWDNWVTFMRVRKGSRMRFCQEVLSLFWAREAWGTSSSSKWRCPVGNWNQESLMQGWWWSPHPGIMNTRELPVHGAWPRWWHQYFLIVCDLLCVSMTQREGWLSWSLSHSTSPPPPLLLLYLLSLNL